MLLDNGDCIKSMLELKTNYMIDLNNPTSYYDLAVIDIRMPELKHSVISYVEDNKQELEGIIHFSVRCG